MIDYIDLSYFILILLYLLVTVQTGDFSVQCFWQQFSLFHVASYLYSLNAYIFKGIKPAQF